MSNTPIRKVDISETEAFRGLTSHADPTEQSYKEIDYPDALFAIAFTLANQHIKGYINKEAAMEMFNKNVSALISQAVTEARIDTAKTIQEITQERFINDMQLVDIYRDKDNKVISINNTVCQNYIDRLAQLKENK